MNAKPMSAAQLLALAGELADEAAIELAQGGFQNRKLHAALDAFVTARAASTVTLEEVMLIMGNRFENGQLTPEEEEEWERTTREHARRLAREGGGQ